MKRPKWAVIIGTIWLSLVIDISAIRTRPTTSTSTTSTTTEAPLISNETDTNSTEPLEETETKPTLSGLPQIDYIHDPNLPRELNGFNLSHYPFYATVPPPEEFDFKCDGLHDGFYASIPHKCQVYHHCLYGTRYDFLCANYTAFDQKTFICQFVSEVDCVNSAKFFHRNDALYQTPTTTTTSTTTTTTIAPRTTQPPPSAPGRKPGYGGSRRRNPSRRRRPQYDYYDDKVDDYDEEYYDEPVRGRGNRKRPQRPRRPSAEYDEYEEDYDARYDRRGYNRRPSERRRPADEERRRPMDEERRRPADDDRKRPARPDEDRRKMYDDEDGDRKPVAAPRGKPMDDIDVEERRSFNDRRRPYDDDYDRPVQNERRRRPYDERRSSSDDDGYERRRPSESDRRRRPVKDYDEDTPKPQITPMSSSSVFNKPRAPPIIRRPVPLNERDKYDYTSSSTSLPAKPPPSGKDMEYLDDYEDEPIRPVKNGRKPAVEPPPRYNSNRPRVKKPYEDEEEDVKPKRRPAEEPIRSNKRRPIDDEKINDEPRAGSKRRPVYEDEPVDEKVLETTSRFRKPGRMTTTPKPKVISTRATTTTVRTIQKQPTLEEDYYDDTYEDINPIKPTERLNEKALATTEKREIVTEGRSSKNDNPLLGGPKREPYVKILKRPFLPSRGGNPLAARGLSPVGARAQDVKPETTTTTTTTTPVPEVSSPKHVEDDYHDYAVDPEPPKEELPNIRINLRGNFNVGGARNSGSTGPDRLKTSAENDAQNTQSKEAYVPKTDYNKYSHQDVYRGAGQYQPTTYDNLYRSTEMTTPKVKESLNAVKNPLDLIEEYDVTLNDALNPTIPNIPNRNSPSGFILPRDDYQFSGYTRSRYVNYEPLNQASSDFTYQVQDPAIHTSNSRSIPQYQSPQFLPQYHPTNYNTRTVRGHQQYTANF